LSAIDPATGHHFDANNLVTNWPQLFTDLGPHMGWIIGVLIASAIYFYLYAEWQSGSLLFVQMAGGSLAVFLIGPVLLSNFFGSVGGFRMMAPRIPLRSLEDERELDELEDGAVTSQTARPKSFATNLASATTSFFAIHRTRPLRIIVTVSIPSSVRQALWKVL